MYPPRSESVLNGLKTPKYGALINKCVAMNSEKLLRELYKAISGYFSPDNEFRRNPSSKTWDKRQEADGRLCITMGIVKKHLTKGNDETRI